MCAMVAFLIHHALKTLRWGPILNFSVLNSFTNDEFYHRACA